MGEDAELCVDELPSFLCCVPRVAFISAFENTFQSKALLEAQKCFYQSFVERFPESEFYVNLPNTWFSTFAH